jgi:hypothetical protein
MHRRFSVLVVALGLAGSSACSYGPEDYCQDLCDCEGCSDEELDDCIDDAEDLYDAATDAGCEDLADEYLACLSDEVECRGDDFDADGCEREYQDGLECIGDRPNVIDGDDDDDGPSDDDGSSTGDASSSGGGGEGGGPTIAAWCEVPTPSPSQGSCVTLGGNIACNPVTNAPCGDDEMVCDAIGTPSDGFQCYSVSSQAPLCATCDSPCEPGTLCTGDLGLPTSEQCAKVCCDDGDCGGGVCVKQGVAVAGADIGVCLASAP